jgi:hypothetical protein
MIIKEDLIICNSFPEFYDKEKIDLKNNTVRTVTSYEMEKIKQIRENNKQNKIQIVNTDTFEYFIRNLRDISYYCLYSERWVVIFTWDEHDKKK